VASLILTDRLSSIFNPFVKLIESSFKFVFSVSANQGVFIATALNF